MTKFLEPSFSTLPPAGAAYRDRWDAIFAKKEKSRRLQKNLQHWPR